MKEAAGEANITVITIVLIALVLAVGTPIINSLLTRMAKNSCCSAVGGHMSYKKWNESSSSLSCFDSDNNWIEESVYWDSTNNKCKN